MSQRSIFYPPGGPSYEVSLNGRPFHAGSGYRGPDYARPGPNYTLFRERGADWIHRGQYPLSQRPGFEMQHNFFWMQDLFIEDLIMQNLFLHNPLMQDLVLII
jgi:hypothetical protein